jgi:hypothetical protein
MPSAVPSSAGQGQGQLKYTTTLTKEFIRASSITFIKAFFKVAGLIEWETLPARVVFGARPFSAASLKPSSNLNLNSSYLKEIIPSKLSQSK